MTAEDGELRPLPWRRLALALATGVFMIDTLTPPQVEFAPLYAIVLLVADNNRLGQWIWAWAAGCIAAGLLTFILLFQRATATANAESLGVGVATILAAAYALARRSEAVATSEQQSRALDVAPSAIVVREPSGRIVLWNRAAAALYGWSRREAQGANAFALFAPGAAREGKEIEAALAAAGRWSGEVHHRRRDGREVAVLSDCSVFGSGPRAFVVESNLDAEAQRAADATRLDEQRYRRIYDTLAIAIWEHDLRPVKAATQALRARGVDDVRRYVAEHPQFVREVRRTVRITDVNATALRLMGVGAKSQFFARLADFLPEDDPSFADCILAIDENRPTFVSETRVRSATGELIPILVALSFPPGEGLDRITGSIFDLREQMQLRTTVERTRAELEHALRAASLGELTGSIAHEVNQPLSAVMSYAHASRRWLNRQPPELAEARTALDDVLNAAQQASDVVRRVRKLMGKVEPERLPVALDALVAETVRLVRPQAEAHEVGLETDLDAGSVEVLGDRILLQQVLVNLVNNAVQALEASPAAPRHILISTWADGEEVLVAVEDTGPGFSEEAAQRAFQSFFTTKARGMGLGLSISRATVEAHGGALSIDRSARMGGARLRVSLPRAGRSVEGADHGLQAPH